MLEKQQQRLTLNMLNLALILNGAYVVNVLLTYGIESPQAWKISLLFVVLLGVRLLAQRLMFSFTPVIVLSVVVFGMYANFIFGGNALRAPAFTAGVGFLIVYTGLLKGRKGALIMLGLHALIILALAWLERKGIYFTQPKMADIPITISGQLLFFGASTYMLISTLNELRQHLDIHKQEAHFRSRAERKIRKLNRDLIQSYEITLRGWARALELKDKETEGHCHRVVDLAHDLGQAYGLDSDQLSQLEYGALLHDIGKMGIPDAILHKEGPLNDEEWELMHQHPQLGYELLHDVEYLKDAMVIPLCHHEHWDGSGYPNGLKGEDIPLLARIFTIADVWDALTSPRCYSEAWSRQKALAYLRTIRGTKLDPELTDIFLNIMDEALISERLLTNSTIL